MKAADNDLPKSGQKRIGVVIPVCQPGAELAAIIQKLNRLPAVTTPIIVDSTPGGMDASMLATLQANIYRIPPTDFSHGKTREQYRRSCGTRYVLFLTQDVIITDGDWLNRLAEPVISGRAAAAYARQLPRADADFFSRFDRAYNYPPEPRLQTAAGYPVARSPFFCSNSCALWDNDALDHVGGFPPVEHNEDMLAAAKLIHTGHAIAYVAESCVVHSHPTDLPSVFRRYFAIGRELARNAALFGAVGGHGGSGLNYATSLLLRVTNARPWLLPKALLLLGSKAFGYLAGKIYARFSSDRAD